ncbi:Putative oxo-4-hydroxy-4-carboxy-5-ureidoimidazoline decarboxylase [Septoria linicola]|uniref:Oxo-4-hydroxy-4-carboxy-5-ureidoimidazoline decarboxylase n=1 Tax=Septoria linicola TaxID=215465 RepID=A0A9Q9ARU7_9PEZI|nr:putative oxo-4-hydroxy-4-carboxy-5-ureidoimidazoline decarboxylase [Septoria linicola]USW49616.1 Putative oxo-4-hydroxy-4-carboxy-5-ureidoimidazoline decarboxylase [Septoria linicola]
METRLPHVTAIPGLPTQERANILDLLFEPSTQLHTLSVPLLHENSFANYADLISAVGVQLMALAESVSKSDTAWLESILGAHPRLGAKKVDSTQSQSEQAHLQGNPDEGERLRALNEEYERQYPGLRYVVFVNGRSRSAVMDDMRNRIANSDLKSERAAAIRAMCEIAADRANKLTDDSHMSPNNQDNATGSQQKQPLQSTTTDESPAMTDEEKKQALAKLRHVLKQTGISSGQGTQKTQKGLEHAGFVDVPLTAESADVPEEPDYEFINARDTSHDGQQHRSYNGQADHVRKYPSGFGKESK